MHIVDIEIRLFPRTSVVGVPPNQIFLLILRPNGEVEKPKVLLPTFFQLQKITHCLRIQRRIAPLSYILYSAIIALYPLGFIFIRVKAVLIKDIPVEWMKWRSYSNLQQLSGQNHFRDCPHFVRD